MRKLFYDGIYIQLISLSQEIFYKELEKSISSYNNSAEKLNKISNNWQYGKYIDDKLEVLDLNRLIERRYNIFQMNEEIRGIKFEEFKEGFSAYKLKLQNTITTTYDEEKKFILNMYYQN